jgi:two-component system CheB/CheR fusion protein
MSTAPARTEPSVIVGIGASAGGIEAMRQFLSATPAETGLGFVLVMHLQPDHRSHLSEVLGQATALRVVEAQDGQRVQGDTLHVIPPDATLTIQDGVLHLLPQGDRHLATGIDSFFRALAEDRQDRAICAVLSGAGSDGALGLRAVKEYGGLALAAQTEDAGDSARGSMPRAAAATGLADYIVPIEQMPAIAVEYARHLGNLAQATDARGLPARIEAALPEICARIRERTGHDLRQYKPATLVRRIQRRLQSLRQSDPADYLARLDDSPDEIEALHKDILIGVTAFFRDPDAFDALERTVVTDLLERAARQGRPVRVWVPGCGSGEEAYSLAMILDEARERHRVKAEVQVFGTDVNGDAIRRARAGQYPQAAAGQIGRNRRRRYLEQDGEGCRIAPAIRDLCMFSEHDLTRHPPFSRIDLISCRNLLIYLDADLQARVVPLFHYALRPGGYLFLGSSETLGQHAGLFEPLDKKHRIFQRRDTAAHALPDLPMAGAAYRIPHMPTPPRANESMRERLTRRAERLVLEQFGPAYVLVDKNNDAVHFAAGIGRYLVPPAGTPRSNVLDMARSGLRSVLRRALRKAAESGDAIVEDSAEIVDESGSFRVDLVVRPVQERGSDERLLLVVFREAEPREAAEETARDTASTRDDVASELERELADTKSDLQATIEDLEASNEELQSANEELLSMNEELQSSNEELESSKEELQSVNEEMETVNEELRRKVDELNRVNADLRNLIESTRIATLFLDRDLRIKWFTPDARSLFNLIDPDIGRPFTDISGNLDALPGRELQAVLEQEQPVERQVRRTDSTATYIMRLMPYRTGSGTVDGLVLTFVDITQLRELSADLESLLDLVPAGIALTRDTDAARVRINRHGRQLLGLQQPELDRDALDRLFADTVAGDGAPALPLYEAALTGAAIGEREITLRASGRTRAHAALVSAAPLGEIGTPGRGAIMAFVDVSDLKTAQRHQELLLRALRHRVRNMLSNIRAMANETLASSHSLSDFEERFEGRLDALALTESIVSRTGAGSVDLDELAGELLKGWGDMDTITLQGPPVALEPRAGQMLALVLNELRTNAIKHGDLIDGAGRVVLRWGAMTDADGRPILRLRWQETGIGLADEPGKGFGRELIEHGVPHDLGGRGSWQVADGLLTCLIDVPLEPHVLEIGAEGPDDDNGLNALPGGGAGTDGDAR